MDVLVSTTFKSLFIPTPNFLSEETGNQLDGVFRATFSVTKQLVFVRVLSRAFYINRALVMAIAL